jgi:hypothetical protein
MPGQVPTCILHELKTKWAICSQAAEETVHVRGMLLAENEWQESGAMDKHKVLCKDWFFFLDFPIDLSANETLALLTLAYCE